MISRRTKLALLATLLAIVAVLVAGLLEARKLNQPLRVDSTVIIEVSRGSNFNQLVQQLVEKGYLENGLPLKLWARFTGNATRIQAGDYELTPTTSALSLLAKLERGEVKNYQLTLVEGWTFQQALDAIWASPRISITLHGKSGAEISNLLALLSTNPEGWIFPDTYYYSGLTSDLEILTRAHQRMQLILSNAWSTRLGALPYGTPYDALIMASIIEKESSLGSERGHIAGVFIRRLEIAMRLQSDPTVIYGLGEAYNGNLTRADLQLETPYNTYRVNGLPPTPIALPGQDSIIASMNPLSSGYLYFVSKGDGSHFFSSNIDEHNAAVRRFQLGLTE